MTWKLTPQYEREIRRLWIDEDRWAEPCGEHRIRTGQDHEVLEGVRHARTAIASLLAELDILRADKVRADTRSTQTLGELRRRADDVDTRVSRAEAAVRRVEQVRTWTNEDGRRFLFADDVLAALAPEVALKLAESGADRG